MKLIIVWILCLLTLNTAFAIDSDRDIVDQSSSHDTPDDTKHKAIDWELLYIGDGVYGFSGPYNDNSTLLDNLLFNVTIDSEKLFSLKGNTIFLTYIGIWVEVPIILLVVHRGLTV